MFLDSDYHLILKSERKKSKKTQKEIAEIIGISRSYYNDIENGKTIPSGKMLFKINKVLPIFFIPNDADCLQGGLKNEENG
ncbi:MAG: helix-turn-helix transcriptional regulator [Niallia sp.]